jgi:hypothetical protein
VVLFSFGLQFLFIFDGIWVDVSFKFKLLLNSTEFNSALIGAFLEKALGIGEGAHKFLEFFFLEAEAVSRTVD